MDSDSDEEENYIFLGTPLPDNDDDALYARKASELPAHDKKGRPRFHGAFTGGFSAGYFNTVGSKEGFEPAKFVSRRDRTEDDETFQQRPEDFMDEEDFGEHGIDPRKLVTSDKFTSEESKKRRLERVDMMASGTLLSGVPALADLVIPERTTVGVQLLKKMGWKEGQGIGERQTRRKKNSSATNKVYGCSLPPEPGEDQTGESSGDEEFYPENVTFAPRDVNAISFEPKDNTHGLGYKGLDPSLALPSLRRSETPAKTQIMGRGRKGISGTAFGVGALEDEDDDIYGKDNMANYDLTMELEPEGQTYGWTAPGRPKPGHTSTPADYVGKLIEGFKLSTEPLEQPQYFPPPALPKNFVPRFTFPKSSDRTGVAKETGPKAGNQLNAITRSLMLGETPIIVHDLNSKSGSKETDEATSPTRHKKTSRFSRPDDEGMDFSETGVGEAIRTETAMMTDRIDQSHERRDRIDQSHERRGRIDQSHERRDRIDQSHERRDRIDQSHERRDRSDQSQERKGSFKPFVKDPSKQARYDLYLSNVKAGNSDPYRQVAEEGMTEWEREREREEFRRAAHMYQPLPHMMASRFTSAKYGDDVETVVEKEGPKDDRTKAAEMKMYGQLTRETLPWHPDKLVCKRFNVPNPYPDSTIVGIPTLKKDKMSIFNFLDFSGEPGRKEETEATPRMIEYPEKSNSNQNIPPKVPERRETTPSASASSRRAMASIFSHLTDVKVTQGKEESSVPSEAAEDETEKGHNSEETSVTDTGVQESPAIPGLERPSMDVFKAIFGNSSSEDSNSDADDTVAMDTQDQNKETQNDIQHAVLPGNNQPIETLAQRMSPGIQKEASPRQPDSEAESYGPALPPAGPRIPSAEGQRSAAADLIDLTRDHKQHKHKDRHRDGHKSKHKKEKKAKHKKEKKKKKHKKKDKNNSSDSDESDNED